MALTLDHVVNSLASSSGVLTINNTGAITIAKGTTAQRPGVPVVGMTRYNTSLNQPEVYTGASPAWQPIQVGSGDSLDDAIGLVIALG